ncbi:hypothetical protein ACQKMD_20155, partial [Viridibacillus sp. NPDC096237]
MNADKRNYGQNNDHMPDKYVDHNHDVSCGCGCQQSKYEYEQEQKNEEYNNQYMSNKQISQNYDGSCSYNQEMKYSVADESMKNNIYDGRTYESMQDASKYGYTNYSGSCDKNIPQLNTMNLPIESRRFQTITTINSNTNRGLDALRTQVGDRLGGGLSNYCRDVTVQNQVTNDIVNGTGNPQRFIFYSTDSGQFVIANQQFGEVLEYVTNGESIVTRLYNGNSRQLFRKVDVSTENFRLEIEGRGIIPCGNNANTWTRIIAFPLFESSNFLFRHQSNHNVSVTVPSLRTSTPLEPIPELTNLNDAGPSPAQAPRAVIGSALIPCLFINDVIPLDRRIRESPYYVLEYRQYWHRLWSDSFFVGGSRTVTEETGISTGAQENMRNTINMSIGADWGLQFFQQSNPFSQQILSGLSTSRSFTTVPLGPNIAQSVFRNPNQFTTRFSRFARAFEYQLRRTDGTIVGTWVAVDNRSMYIKTFPHNAPVMLEDQKIVRSNNSYDLSVWKTPMIIKDGEIKTKNE